MTTQFSALELCAGGGGQALGLENAGFGHEAVVEIDHDACMTLRHNRPQWKMVEGDIGDINGRDYRGIDLIAGGVPCPPFSIAGQRLGAADERDLFPQALRIIAEANPRAVLLENVRGLATTRFADFRADILRRLHALGYVTEWQIINASEHGVPQLRPRFVLLGVKERFGPGLAWPQPQGSPPTVGECIGDLMAAGGWPGAVAWASRANAIGPTLVGGSRKHGGPDLGPTRARSEWARLGVNGSTVALAPPSATDPLDLSPRLTLRMVARLQGFPDDWQFAGRKTAAYRQIGNAFPPPVAEALGSSIARALGTRRNRASRITCSAPATNARARWPHDRASGAPQAERAAYAAAFG